MDTIFCDENDETPKKVAESDEKSVGFVVFRRKGGQNAPFFGAQKWLFKWGIKVHQSAPYKKDQQWDQNDARGLMHGAERPRTGNRSMKGTCSGDSVRVFFIEFGCCT
jgi:hypothetical protein